jgi:serine/threonine protein kinase
MDFINQTIGKYKLIRKIGEGGMAYVYEGIHEKLETRVAVKILNPVLSVNQQIRIRFENEVKLLASLDHPNIIRVIDYDESPGRLAIIMEYLTGSDLSTILKTRGAFSPENVKDIFRQIMSAFQYAHEQGIVHRDIKPSNIFITEKGQVKILDFGIAKIFGTGDDMTSTGAQIGTLIYMSPEQVKGDKSIDHRSDIYSLGVTLYSMLKGKPPYNPSVSSHYEISHQIVTQPLPRLDTNSPFASFIENAVEKDRNSRYQSLYEMMEAFENISGADSLVSDSVKPIQYLKSQSTAVNSSKRHNRTGTDFLIYLGAIILSFGLWSKILHLAFADMLLTVGALTSLFAFIIYIIDLSKKK